MYDNLFISYTAVLVATVNSLYLCCIYRAQHSCNDMKMTLWDPLKIVVSEKGKTGKRFLDQVSFLLEIEKLYK